MSKETLADKVERLRKDNRRKRDLIRKLRKQIEIMRRTGETEEPKDCVPILATNVIGKVSEDFQHENNALWKIVDLLLEAKRNHD